MNYLFGFAMIVAMFAGGMFLGFAGVVLYVRNRNRTKNAVKIVMAASLAAALLTHSAAAFHFPENKQGRCAAKKMETADCAVSNCYRDWSDEGQIRACKLSLIFKCINPCYQQEKVGSL